MAEWWSIEVLHGEFSAFRWQEQHDSALIEAALTNGAVDGAWHADRWGIVFEICFDDEERWETFRRLPAVRAVWTACQIPSTACSSTAAGAAEQGTASRASPGRRRARVLSRCPSPAPRRIWTSPVGAENLCHLAGCSAGRRLFGPVPGLPGHGMIFGLWG